MITNKTIRDFVIAKKLFKGSEVITDVTIKDDIVTFESNNTYPLKECTCFLNPIQEGTGDPSPSNVRPITGFTGVNVTRCGKNLFDKNTSSNWVNWGILSGGVISENSAFKSAILRCSPNTLFTASKTLGARIGLASFTSYPTTSSIPSVYDFNNTGIQISITTGANDKYILVWFRNGNVDTATSQEIANTLQVEKGSVTTYEAYKSETYTKVLGQTVYGGTLDLVSGLLTITHGAVDMGSLEWSYDSINGKFYTTISDIVDSSGYGRPSPFLCSCYKVINQAGQGSSVEDISIYLQYNVNKRVWCKDTNYTTSEDFTNSVTGQKLVYELTTPTYFTFTSKEIRTSEGENTFYHDGNGEIELTYQSVAGQGDSVMQYLPLFYGKKFYRN